MTHVSRVRTWKIPAGVTGLVRGNEQTRCCFRAAWILPFSCLCPAFCRGVSSRGLRCPRSSVVEPLSAGHFLITSIRQKSVKSWIRQLCGAFSLFFGAFSLRALTRWNLFLSVFHTRKLCGVVASDSHSEPNHFLVFHLGRGLICGIK